MTGFSGSRSGIVAIVAIIAVGLRLGRVYCFGIDIGSIAFVLWVVGI